MPYSLTDLLKAESENLGVDFATPFCFENPLYRTACQIAIDVYNRHWPPGVVNPEVKVTT